MNRLDSRFDGVLRRREVRLTEAEVDCVLARRLEHFADARDRYRSTRRESAVILLWGQPARLFFPIR